MTDILPIEITPISQSRINEVDFSDLKFGKSFSDHMFVADYSDGQWHNLQILPYQPLSFNPAMSALHYGQAIFEGMKAYRNIENEIVVFRPEANWERLNHSAERLCMPAIPKDIFMSGLQQLLQLDAKWVPNKEGSSLYIRPFMFATDEYVGIRPSDNYKFIIFTSPVDAYYSQPLRVRVETHYTRASEGGTGFAKTAGNYAVALYPSKIAQAEGYQQLLWTDAKEHKYFEESGTMNLMFVIDNKLVTPSLETATILSGITRNSVITLAKEWGIPVEERRVSVAEVVEAAKNGTLNEAFGVGTAAVIAPIIVINHEGTDYQLPAMETRVLSKRIGKALDDIKHSRVADTHNWIYKI